MSCPYSNEGIATRDVPGVDIVFATLISFFIGRVKSEILNLFSLHNKKRLDESDMEALTLFQRLKDGTLTEEEVGGNQKGHI